MRLVDYLPSCENGSILITSRDRGTARTLVEEYNILTVERMTQQESEALVKTKLGPQQDKAGSTGLVIALECIPLAIVQATAYISRRTQWSIQRYLEQQAERPKESRALA